MTITTIASVILGCGVCMPVIYVYMMGAYPAAMKNNKTN